ncbi:MAG: hypothetical protein AAF937_11495 [Planctomycetota bacterium]
MLTKTIAATMSVSTLLCLAGTVSGQPTLEVDGESIPFSGTFEEYLVPDLRGSVVRFVVHGGDGGDAVVGTNASCRTNGGQGARVVLSAVIGSDDFQLRPGQPVRFIVGEGGETARDRFPDRAAGGGGGGGSAVVYRDPDFDERNGWRMLAVAGGGGGASVATVRSMGFFQQCANSEQDGGAGEMTTNGGDGQSIFGDNPLRGGMDGEQGQTSASAGSGAGAFGQANRVETGDRGFGRNGVDPVGGRGGLDGGNPSARGGFGFGGGGAGSFASSLSGSSGGGGGGGGGFSGGAAGDTQSAGGGGGSLANNEFAFGTPQLDRNSPVGENGRIDYSFIGQTHDSFVSPLPVDVGTNGSTVISGSTRAATPSPLQGTPGTFLPDVWYSITNDESDCPRTILFDWESSVRVQVAVSRDGFNADSVDDDGDAEVVIEPGETVLIRIASVDPTFSIGITAIDDTDGDGVCDAIDICPGVDDTMLDPADDVDGDGIHDVCDRLCPEDVIPDGVFDTNDLQQIAIVVALGTDEDALQFDIDNSGEFDYFDWVEYFDGCE